MFLFQEIESYRKKNKAPVDFFGCEKLSSKFKDKERRFCVLVSALLSSQTRDEITAKAVLCLEKKGLLSVKGLLKASIKEIEEGISNVGFYRKKSFFLKEIAKILDEKYNQDIPKSFEQIKKLPGIGEKIGLLIMQHGWFFCFGISVDTHVHKVFNRIGIVETKTVKETQIKLEEIFEKDYWPIINPVVVGFGQICCTTKKPKCNFCPIEGKCKKRGLRSKTKDF